MTEEKGGIVEIGISGSALEFQVGQRVRCVNAKMEGCGPALNQGGIYTVTEFIPPEKCASVPYEKQAEWSKNGGRVSVSSAPHCYFYGRRFVAVDERPRSTEIAG